MLRRPSPATTFRGLHTAYPQLPCPNGARKGKLYPVVEKYVEENTNGLAPKEHELEGVW